MTARRRRPAADRSIIDRLSSTDPRDWMTEAELEELPSLLEALPGEQAWQELLAITDGQQGMPWQIRLGMWHDDCPVTEPYGRERAAVLAQETIHATVAGRRRAACREEAERVVLGWC